MRIVFLAASVAVIGAMATPSIAADLAVPQRKEAAIPTKAPAKEAACLRWHPQTYSWYNYCDPIPYYGRHQNHGIGLF